MRRLLRTVPTVAALALVLLLVLGQRAVAEGAHVDGSSMEPTFHDGQYVLLDKTVYLLSGGPHRGDVIVFKYPLDTSRDFIKRVIGVPGDSIEVRNGVLLVNDTPVQENYLPPDLTTAGNYPRTLVPAYDYFVMGDNRNNSSDSRIWGFVPRDNIVGKEVFAYWPFSGDHSLDFEVLGKDVSIPLP